MIHLDYRDARPIYSQICDGIREQILTGILCPGDRMPSVRELAAELTINPNTIQRAYRELEIQGWIASVPGKGSFISGVPAIYGEKHSQAWTKFDQAVENLLALGFSREDLCRRLNKGGNDNA